MTDLARFLLLDCQLHKTQVSDIYLQSCDSQKPAQQLAAALKKQMPADSPAVRVHGTLSCYFI